MLDFINVTKRFDTVTAVKNISFKVDEGKVLGIVGRNGAGKSTIFRMILNLIEPTEGVAPAKVKLTFAPSGKLSFSKASLFKPSSSGETREASSTISKKA